MIDFKTNHIPDPRDTSFTEDLKKVENVSTEELQVAKATISGTGEEIEMYLKGPVDTLIAALKKENDSLLGRFRDEHRERVKIQAELVKHKWMFDYVAHDYAHNCSMSVESVFAEVERRWAERGM